MLKSSVVLFGICFSLIGAARGAAADSTAILTAGVFDADVTPPIGVPLAGHGSIPRRALLGDPLKKHPYATLFKPSEGILDPIRAKAMVLKKGDRRLAFVSMDLVAVTSEFRNSLYLKLAPLGYKEQDIFVSATHTHNGPGAIAKEKFWQIIAVDRFVPEIYDGILNKTVEMIQKAEEQLQPAMLFAYSFEVKDLQLNRREVEGHFDPITNVLYVSNYFGDVLGAMVNVAVHGTALNPRNLMLSADVPGGMERAFEARLKEKNRPKAKDPVVLFVNGAEGDVAPALEGEEAIPVLGERFAEQAAAAMSSARWINADWEVRRNTVDVGKPRFSLKSCMSRKMPGWMLSKKIGIKLTKMFPRTVEVSALVLGDMMMMTWPGEPTTSLGLALKDIAREVGAQQAWVLALTNDHRAYFVTPEEYEGRGYESCSSIYGANGGMKVVQGYRNLILSWQKWGDGIFR